MRIKNLSYNQLLKATSILGSSQLVGLALRLLRTKLIAIILGPMGIGLISIFQSIVDSITSIGGLGLGAGAVREISFVKTKFRKWKLDRTILIFRRWFVASAILGGIICISASYPITMYYFNDKTYLLPVLLLSIAIFFTILANGRTSILQGLRQIPALAKTTIIDSFLSLILTSAIYYYWDVKGIVWVFVINSIVLFLCLQFFYKRVGIQKSRANTIRTINTGIRSLRLGMFITIGGCINALSMLAIKYFLNYYSDTLDAVGLYQSAWTISTVFAGFIITSAGTDYYAKLCEVSNKNKEVKKLVNEQSHIVLTISTPVIIGIVLFSYYILHSLYSEDFGVAQNLLLWQMLGIFFKLAATPMASILLAKNKGFLYLWSEAAFFITYVTSCYYLIPLYDITGAGISYLIAYVVYLSIILILGYGIADSFWDKKMILILAVGAILIGVSFYIALLKSEYILSFGLSILAVSVIISIYTLSTMLSFEQIKSWLKK